MHEQRLLDNPDGWHGAELSVIIAGNWQYYRAKVLKYLQQIAVITPYSQVRFCVCVVIVWLVCPLMMCWHWQCRRQHKLAHGRYQGIYLLLHLHLHPHHTHLPSVRSPSPARPQFQFVFKGEDEKNSISVLFARRTTTMPQPPKVGQPLSWFGGGGWGGLSALAVRRTACQSPAVD